MDFHNHCPKTAFKKLCETSLPEKYLKKIEESVNEDLREKIKRKKTGDEKVSEGTRGKRLKLKGRQRRNHFSAVCKATTDYIKNLEKVLLTVIDEKMPKNQPSKTSIPMDICQVTDLLFPGFQRQVLKSAVEGEVSEELRHLCTSAGPPPSALHADRAVLKHFAQFEQMDSSPPSSSNTPDELMWTLQQLSRSSPLKSSSTDTVVTTALNSHTHTSASDAHSHRLRHWTGGSLLYQTDNPSLNIEPLVIAPQGDDSSSSGIGNSSSPSSSSSSVSMVSTTTLSTTSISTSWASQTAQPGISASSASDVPQPHFVMSDYGSASSCSSGLYVSDKSVYGALLAEAARCPPAASFTEFDAFVGIDRPALELPLEDIEV